MTNPHPLSGQAARPRKASWRSAVAMAATLVATMTAGAATPATTAATDGGNAARGQAFFNAQHGREWRCASCHGALPVTAGRHASTGKTIEPLAPAANPQRFSDPAKVEKWFRRNCNDVLGRECSAGEKADVVAWLTSLRP